MTTLARFTACHFVHGAVRRALFARPLELSGRIAVEVEFELSTAGNRALRYLWEHWDGKVWRPFRDMRPECSNEEANQLDSTGGMRSSGASWAGRGSLARPRAATSS